MYMMYRLFCCVMDYAHVHKTELFKSVHRRASRLTLTRQLTPRTQLRPEEPPDEKGSLFREIYSLIEALVRSLDLRGIVVGSRSLADLCPGIVTFFQQAVETIRSTRNEMSRQRELKNTHLVSYGLSLLIPSLTTLFNHIGFHDTSRLLIQRTVLTCCRITFQSLIEMATGVTPVYVGTYVRQNQLSVIYSSPEYCVFGSS